MLKQHKANFNSEPIRGAFPNQLWLIVIQLSREIHLYLLSIYFNNCKTNFLFFFVNFIKKTLALFNSSQENGNLANRTVQTYNELAAARLGCLYVLYFQYHIQQTILSSNGTTQCHLMLTLASSCHSWSSPTTLLGTVPQPTPQVKTTNRNLN